MIKYFSCRHTSSFDELNILLAIHLYKVIRFRRNLRCIDMRNCLAYSCTLLVDYNLPRSYTHLYLKIHHCSLSRQHPIDIRFYSVLGTHESYLFWCETVVTYISASIVWKSFNLFTLLTVQCKCGVIISVSFVAHRSPICHTLHLIDLHRIRTSINSLLTLQMFCFLEFYSGSQSFLCSTAFTPHYRSATAGQCYHRSVLPPVGTPWSWS